MTPFEQVDLRLLGIVLAQLTDDLAQQIQKPRLFRTAEPRNVLYEVNKSQKLKPPFAQLSSPDALVGRVLRGDRQGELFGLDRAFDPEDIASCLHLILETGLAAILQLDETWYQEHSKILITPLGIVTSIVITRTDPDVLTRMPLQGLMRRSAEVYARSASAAFMIKVRTSITRGQALGRSQVILMFLLLAYGAIRRNTAFRIEVDAATNISKYDETISTELNRLGTAMLGSKYVPRGTLLDQIQESGKIRGVLDDPDLYQRQKEGRIQYIYFDVAQKGFDAAAINRLDSVIRALMRSVAAYNKDAPARIIAVLRDKAEASDPGLSPVEAGALFGEWPSGSYLEMLRSRAESVAATLGEVEEETELADEIDAADEAEEEQEED